MKTGASLRWNGRVRPFYPGLSTLPLPGFRREDGGCTRIRTLDPLIKSQLLYQLSYAPGGRGKPRRNQGAFHSAQGGFVQPLGRKPPYRTEAISIRP